MHITISPEAAAIYHKEIAKRGGVGILIALKQSGCNGWKYHAEVVLVAPNDALSFTSEGIMFYVAKDSESDIDGLVIRIAEGGLQRKIEFWHPDMVGSCGCGQSVTLKRKKKA